jgi:serine/threonine-protein kinase
MKIKVRSMISDLKASRHWRLARWPYYAGIVLLSFLIVGTIGNLIVMPLVTRHWSEFPAPSVIGRDLREAEAILKEEGLRLGIESRQHSPTVTEGVILDQVPRPRAMVKKDRRVMVIISAGTRMTVVPLVRGYTSRQAQLMLDEAGLSLGGESYARDDSLPPGVIISSIPTGGGSVPMGTIVNLLVNEADEFGLVTVPILVGENIKKAEAILEERGLVLGAVDREADAYLLPGTVVRQSVPAGEQVRRGTAIDLTMTTEDR